ncbi:MAG: hypothetical protein JWQ90_3762 [Hydrocarboniphaga sp.]|uniref:hypothetical protein n=1 Tax=Hydrocarboniphaga sp. TaxID=2033016 RepID=UPI002631B78E|nr:hypothetical protein [Hydrocarboniphaga sp.]MDB5971312.1 hypothetical protein [Hydrocarboniphaga sp.]
MNDPIPKISIQDLSALLGAALGAPARAGDVHDAVLKQGQLDGEHRQPKAGDLLEQLIKNARCR